MKKRYCRRFRVEKNEYLICRFVSTVARYLHSIWHLLCMCVTASSKSIENIWSKLNTLYTNTYKQTNTHKYAYAGWNLENWAESIKCKTVTNEDLPRFTNLYRSLESIEHMIEHLIERHNWRKLLFSFQDFGQTNAIFSIKISWKQWIEIWTMRTMSSRFCLFTLSRHRMPDFFLQIFELIILNCSKKIIWISELGNEYNDSKANYTTKNSFQRC